jgi:glutathione S-transferase
MSDYELLYFPARGRAEQIRLMFTLQSVPFTDNPATNWGEIKPTTPFGRLPILTERSDDGEFVLAESGAIMRHLGRRFEMVGSSPREHALCDALTDFIADERTKSISVAYAAVIGTTEEAIAAFWKQLPQALGYLERLAQRNSDPTAGWLVTNALTFADVGAFDYLDGLEGLEPGVLKDYPGLQSFVARFRALPAVSAYLAKRG